MSAREPVIIGRYAAPTRRVLRSLNSGNMGQMSNFSGTPRQMERLASVAERDPESRWWWSHAFAACVGATLTLLVVLL